MVTVFLSNIHLTFDLSLLFEFSVLIDGASWHSNFFRAIKKRNSILHNQVFFLNSVSFWSIIIQN